MWWDVLSEFNLLKLRITVQPVKQKVVEPKTQCSFVDSHEGSGRNHLLDVKCCKFFGRLWWLPPGLEKSSRPLNQHHHHYLDQPLG